MVPASYLTYFAASAGAGAALIGLLFVAISVSPEKIFLNPIPERRAVAANAFAALVNAFFISLGALIPGWDIGWFVAVMALLGLWNSLNLGAQLFWRKAPDSWRTLVRRVFLVVASLSIYGIEGAAGVHLALRPAEVGQIWSICVLVLSVYGVGLTRAWELLGATRVGVFSWLSPLHDVNVETPPEATVGAAVQSTTPGAQGEHPGGQ